MKIRKDDKESCVHTLSSWSEISTVYQRVMNGELTLKDRNAESSLEGMREGINFFTVDSEVMQERLRNGYNFEHTIPPHLLPTVTYDRPRPRYTDDPEGEFNNDLYEMGETEHFLVRRKRKSVGGLRLSFDYEFNSSVDGQVIGEYGQWIGSIIESLQSRGFDLEINLYGNDKRTFIGWDRNISRIRLSRFGERVMPHDWSVLFSPGGYRHFGFMRILMTPMFDPTLKVTEGLGQATGKKWDIHWDAQNREILFEVNANSSQFPAEEMTERFNSWKE